VAGTLLAEEQQWREGRAGIFAHLKYAKIIDIARHRCD
jgi:hypothetical protein